MTSQYEELRVANPGGAETTPVVATTTWKLPKHYPGATGLEINVSAVTEAVNYEVWGRARVDGVDRTIALTDEAKAVATNKVLKLGNLASITGIWVTFSGIVANKSVLHRWY